MKIILVFILLLLCPSIVLSHPGKTDKRGGHRCLRDCSEWQLDYGEYHFHDKDFMPIRPAKTRNTEAVAEPPQIPKTVMPAEVPEHTSGNADTQKLQKKSEEILSPVRSAPPVAEDGIVSLIELDVVIFAVSLILAAAFL